MGFVRLTIIQGRQTLSMHDVAFAHAPAAPPPSLPSRWFRRPHGWTDDPTMAIDNFLRLRLTTSHAFPVASLALVEHWGLRVAQGALRPKP